MRAIRIALPALLFLLLPSAASAAGPVAQGKGCEEVVVLTAVPAEAAQAVVPAPFRPTMTAGLAQAGVAVLRCDELGVAGTNSARTEISDTGVVIDDPTGNGGTHYYALWQLTSSPSLRQVIGAEGVDGALVDGLAVESSSGAPLVTHAHGHAPWTESPFELAVDVAGGVALPPSATTWWHRNGSEVVRMDYAIGEAAVNTGLGMISTTPGSRLAEVLGGARAAGAGLVIGGFGFALSVSRSPIS